MARRRQSLTEMPEVDRAYLWEKVREMRRLHATGMAASDIGTQFGLSASHAWSVCVGRSWREEVVHG
jgi:hypothetical protein